MAKFNALLPVITIDEKHCSEYCDGWGWDGGGDKRCDYWAENLYLSKMGLFERCQQCLDAEKANLSSEDAGG